MSNQLDFDKIESVYFRKREFKKEKFGLESEMNTKTNNYFRVQNHVWKYKIIFKKSKCQTKYTGSTIMVAKQY